MKQRRHLANSSSKITSSVAIAALVTCVVCVALMYSPGLPNVTLTPNSLTIHDHFYPVTVNAADIDVAGIRVVNIGTDEAWKPISKIKGFANSHYRSGWFRVASGSVRMYWANGERLVLLPPQGKNVPVLLQVSDPEQFVQAVKQEWSKK